ncbi:glycoside hydrolase family 97 protein [Flavobacterium quisquiliarum]|uniref:Glycoside hydrolase family 97 catalytic domain-containing protein n=1 Tax=Flavobacterium quisquiliarum TaxID=1834436 RepID=A0ABV8W5C3_9FLAO|nr:glycoside hydrolase family 97 protein [Flavobacterium quisquiliarum]MBW1654291.1 glycoside hydrolase family 97 protein [Flavobacterium quisquiliarum]NWL03334.1 alpha-glucosidase [Flavobacterium collinsii]
MRLILFALLFLSYSNALKAQTTSALSPDKNIELKISVTDGKVFYNLFYQKEEFLSQSPLGLLSSAGDFTKDLKLIGKTSSKIQESYKLNRSKVSQVNYLANESKFTFVNKENDTIGIIFRISNNDIAFSYWIPKNKKNTTDCIIEKEITGFKLPSGTTTFITPQAPPLSGWQKTKPSYEEEYTREEKIGTKSQYGLGYTFPALFHLGNKGWLLISETGISGNYPGTRLSDADSNGIYSIRFPQEGENNFNGAVTASSTLPMQTSWKTITLGRTLKPIVESTVATDVVKPLIKSSKIFDTGRASWSWIVWQDESCNYNDQKTFIDLAANLKCEFILIDALWDVNIGKEKMTELVNYAKSKKVGVILWYNSNGNWNTAPQTPKDKMNTSEARRKEMQWLQQIGVKGLKIDFFGGDKQVTMKLYHDILTDAAEFGLGINFHGATLPRGWERMYPNYMTSEAVLASENLVFQQGFSDRYPSTATIYPFTRNTVAAMDFGPVFLNKRLHRDPNKGTVRKTTDAFEMATAVVFFSPVQHWGLTPENLKEKPSYLFDYLKHVPTVWDETLYIDGYPGKYCVIARRKNTKWYVAAINGENVRKKITVNLPMLKGKEISIIADGNDQESKFNTQKLQNTTFDFDLSPNGGTVLFMP